MLSGVGDGAEVLWGKLYMLVGKIKSNLSENAASARCVEAEKWRIHDCSW